MCIISLPVTEPRFIIPMHARYNPRVNVYFVSRVYIMIYLLMFCRYHNNNMVTISVSKMVFFVKLEPHKWFIDTKLRSNVKRMVQSIPSSSNTPLQTFYSTCNHANSIPFVHYQYNPANYIFTIHYISTYRQLRVHIAAQALQILIYDNITCQSIWSTYIFCTVWK